MSFGPCYLILTLTLLNSLPICFNTLQNWYINLIDVLMNYQIDATFPLGLRRRLYRLNIKINTALLIKINLQL